jgi:hypothetical protein
MTTVTQRIGPGLLKIDGRVCMRCVARQGGVCEHSGKAIKRGDKVYRLWGSPIDRGKRWLASEIEKLG